MATKFKKNPKVDKYIKDAASFAQPILKHLRQVVQDGCPQVTETIKWDSPFYTFNDKIVCGMGTFKEHCKFWVKNWKSIAKDNEDSKLAMEKMLHIYTLKDLPSATKIKSLLKQAMKLNEPGAKKLPKAPRHKKPPLKTPAELLYALRANPKALAAYEALAPSHQRHYAEWIVSAKTEATRERRLEKAVDSITAGKTRHWD